MITMSIYLIVQYEIAICIIVTNIADAVRVSIFLSTIRYAYAIVYPASRFIAE